MNDNIGSPTFTPIDGDTLDDIIEENGGVGDWEGGESAPEESVPRWQFPRFPGAEDPADMYLSRSGIGPYDTDVETLVGWLSAPRNMVGAVNLLGEPGTGKTALVEAAVTHMMPDGSDEVDSTLYTHLCTPDDTRDSLFLRFVGEGKGDPLPSGELSPYTLGPIPFACKYGKKLYLDEWMMLVDGVKPVLYPCTDGRRFLPGGNVDGSPLEIHEDFRLVLSSNPMVRGASMPEPMASRCASTTITVETTASLLRDLDVDESVVAAWEALGNAGLWRPQIREVRLADYWLPVDASQAASAFLPEHCPESQREQVKNTVVSFIGGDLRKDGRLVVK
jgi:MoxR-like ATPase